jgi:organic hydroperoxide reductase OsmC/OhrA
MKRDPISYGLSVVWTGNLGEGTSNYHGYERAFELSTPGKTLLSGSSDPQFRGDASRWNPEELFIASLASCHMLWFLHLCADEGIVVNDYRDQATGHLEFDNEGRGVLTEIVLRPKVVIASSADEAKAARLHSVAHTKCFLANALKDGIEIEPVIECSSVFKLEEVVPWGRSFADYKAMFALNETDRWKRILGCGDGPASFNTEATKIGMQVISCDPLYAFSAEAIRSRIESCAPAIADQLRKNADAYHWDFYGSVETVIAERFSAMERFLEDFTDPKASDRYEAGALPRLRYSSESFDLVLVSHLLFLYSAKLDLEMHYQSIMELLRVGREVRIYPLVDLNGGPSPHLPEVLRRLEEAGFKASIEPVSYRFQKGADKMLKIAANHLKDENHQHGQT